MRKSWGMQQQPFCNGLPWTSQGDTCPLVWRQTTPGVCSMSLASLYAVPGLVFDYLVSANPSITKDLAIKLICPAVSGTNQHRLASWQDHTFCA